MPAGEHEPSEHSPTQWATRRTGDPSNADPTPRRPMRWTGVERIVVELFARAGVEIGGSRPHDVQVHDSRFYRRVLASGTLGFGEAYMDGWWDAEAVDETIFHLLESRADEQTVGSPRVLLLALGARLLNLQSPRRAKSHVRGHYERGFDLYEAMLDERMIYSCAYWPDADTLAEAQEAKLNLICRKLGIGAGDSVLDIGCGWGGFARFAAERYGAHVTGVTLSPEQAAVARQRCRGMPVEIQVQDYRSLRGAFDAVVSIGMLEHVGPGNYRAYMEATDRCLAPEGVSLIQTIAGNESTRHIDPWVHRYIFPGSNLPSLRQLAGAAEGLFVFEDVHNFGPDYDRTLMAWNENFERAWPRLNGHYDERFRRMWRFYMLACAATFRARFTQLYHIVLTRPGTPQPPGCGAR